MPPTTKPSSLARWANSGGVIRTPTSGKMDKGFKKKERPAAGLVNWLHNLGYQWQKFVDDLFGATGADADMNLTGDIDQVGDQDVSGQIRVGIGSAAERPCLVAEDQLGNARFMIDWNGLPAGQFSTWDEQWRTTGTTDPPAWDFVNSANGARSYDDPSSSSLPTRTVLLTATADSGSGAALRAYDLAFLYSGMIFTMDWWMRTDGAIDGGDAGRFTAGLQWDHGGANDYSVGFFADKDVNANWQCRIVGGGGTTDFDTGIPIIANSQWRMRLEILGDAMHAGSNFLARFWLNDEFTGPTAPVLVHETTFSDPGQDIIHPYFSVFSPTTDGPYLLRVGEVRCRWTHRATEDFVS